MRVLRILCALGLVFGVAHESWADIISPYTVSGDFGSNKLGGTVTIDSTTGTLTNMDITFSGSATIPDATLGSLDVIDGQHANFSLLGPDWRTVTPILLFAPYGTEFGPDATAPSGIVTASSGEFVSLVAEEVGAADITFTPTPQATPEPASLALLATGGVACGGWRVSRRRRMTE